MTLWGFLTNVLRTISYGLFRKKKYVLVDLRTIPIGYFLKYACILVDFPTFWCGYFLKIPIFWMTTILCVYFLKNVYVLVDLPIFWYILWIFSENVYIFDHLMRFWCGIFSKFIHFGCCGSVLMRIFCIIRQKNQLSGQIRSSLRTYLLRSSDWEGANLKKYDCSTLSLYRGGWVEENRKPKCALICQFMRPLGVLVRTFLPVTFLPIISPPSLRQSARVPM